MKLASSCLIAHTRGVSGKKMDIGPIGTNAAAALRRLREHRRLSYADLSRQLAEKGRPIPPLGLRRIEAGERRIDIDDLLALALALEVSPLAILLPNKRSAVVEGGPEYSPHQIWDWSIGKWPLSGDHVTFVRDSHPERWAELMGDRSAGDAMTLKLIAGELRHSPDLNPAIEPGRQNEAD